MAIGNQLTTREVAEILGVTAGRVHQFVMEKRLEPTQKIGTVLFFAKPDVEKFAKKPRETGRPKVAEKKSRRPIAKT